MRPTDYNLLHVFDEINECKLYGDHDRANLLIRCLQPLGYFYVTRFANGRLESTLYYDPRHDKRNRPR